MLAVGRYNSNEMTSRTPQARGLFKKLLGKRVTPESLADLEVADTYVDEALDALELEEPSLTKWLEGNTEVNGLMQANISAVYIMLYTGLKKGYPLDEIVKEIDKLYTRVIYGTAWRAALRERVVRTEPWETKDGWLRYGVSNDS